jgi:hypothetical protein
VLISKLPSRDAIVGLSARGVDYIVFNHGLALPRELAILQELRGSPYLQIMHESATTSIFQVPGR